MMSTEWKKFKEPKEFRWGTQVFIFTEYRYIPDWQEWEVRTDTGTILLSPSLDNDGLNFAISLQTKITDHRI